MVEEMATKSFALPGTEILYYTIFFLLSYFSLKNESKMLLGQQNLQRLPKQCPPITAQGMMTMIRHLQHFLQKKIISLLRILEIHFLIPTPQSLQTVLILVNNLSAINDQTVKINTQMKDQRPKGESLPRILNNRSESILTENG